MRKSKFTEAQIKNAVKEAGSGASVSEICSKMGISKPTFYNWQKKYEDLDKYEIVRLRELEEENYKLKQIVADLSLDKLMLKAVLKKKL